jgi:GNAT superfamily N-acetyltransferase
VTSIEIRPASGYADLERWMETRNEIVPDDPGDPGMLALIRAGELEHVNLLAWRDGEVVGIGMLTADRIALESEHPYVEVMVPERHRGHGVGTAILADVSERARKLGMQGLHVDARAEDAYSLGFLERRGFVEQYRSDRFVLELAGVDPVDPAAPDGVSIHWLAERPDLVPAAYRVAAATYSELAGPVSRLAGTQHEWQLYELGDPRVAFDLTPVAMAEDEAVGFGILLSAENGTFGMHRVTVVLPGWRRRGVGSALTRAQIAAAKRASLERLEAWAWTDVQRSLFASLGYTARAASIDFFGPLQ